MRRAALALAGLLTGAAAPVPYDALCPAPCVASDGTAQPTGTVLARGLWDGVAPWSPTDAAGLALTKTPTAQPPAPIYTPKVTIGPAVPGPIVALVNQSTLATGTVIALEDASGTVVTPQVVVPPRISGSITHSGRTTSPLTQSFGALTAGTQTKTYPIADLISGPAQIGDECHVVLTNGFPPVGMQSPDCQVVTVGQATVQFQTLASVLASTLTFNIFWRG